MRVAISADDSNGLGSVVSPHFGRCPYYVLVDLEDREVKQVNTVANPYYDHHQRGQVPGFIHSQGADAILTGGMGRRALALFEQYGVEAATGASGTVHYALERYLGGELADAEPCRKSAGHGHEDESAVGAYEQGEVGRLREEAEMLRQQLDEVMARLQKMERRGR